MSIPGSLSTLPTATRASMFFGPGPGVGGHCIAVDPWFLVHAAPVLTPLIETARRVNDDKPRKVVERVLAAAVGLAQADIACLGLSYKADVADLRESPSIAVVRGLQQSAAGRVLVVEPHVDAPATGINGEPWCGTGFPRSGA